MHLWEQGTGRPSTNETALRECVPAACSHGDRQEPRRVSSPDGCRLGPTDRLGGLMCKNVYYAVGLVARLVVWESGLGRWSLGRIRHPAPVMTCRRGRTREKRRM